MIMGTIYLFVASILWGVVHTALASHGFKHAVRNLIGAPAFDRVYRFSYNLFAVASFFPIFMMLLEFPDRMLYSIPSPWMYLMVVGQGIAAIAMIAAVMQTGLWEFVGLSQFSPYYGETKPSGLINDGLYAYVRHPIYLAALVFIWLSPEMTLNRLVLWAVLSIYIVIGAYFEERKLLREFGSEYADYKARTPMLIPYWRKSL